MNKLIEKILSMAIDSNTEESIKKELDDVPKVLIGSQKNKFVEILGDKIFEIELSDKNIKIKKLKIDFNQRCINIQFDDNSFNANLIF